jgi:hypothetical protein
MAKTAYFSMIHLFKSRTIQWKNKIRIYKTIVRSILSYGCEIWTMTNQAEEMLGAFERKTLKRIFCPTQDEKAWRTRYNAEIYDLPKDMKVTEFIKFRRLQWAGHIIRMEEHVTSKKALQQTIHCKRRVGNPRKRCEDGVREDAVELLRIWAWETKAKDREFWGQHIEQTKARYGL